MFEPNCKMILNCSNASKGRYDSLIHWLEVMCKSKRPMLELLKKKE